MSEYRTPSFLAHSFKGNEPLCIISINLGVMTSAVSCFISYPGYPPFYFEPNEATDTVTDGGVIRDFLLRMFPRNVPVDQHSDYGFGAPYLPQHLTMQSILQEFLSKLRSNFEGAIRDVELWMAVEEHARIVFTHPAVWGEREVGMVRKCVEGAGWLRGKRKLSLVSEEEALIANRLSESPAKSNPKHTLVVNECGASAVTIACYEKTATQPFQGKWKGTIEACVAGFAVAYSAARWKPWKRFLAAPFGMPYKMYYKRRQILEFGSGGVHVANIYLTEKQANKFRAESVEVLVSQLARRLTSLAPDTPIILGGNYIGSQEIQESVRQQLVDRGSRFGGVSGPSRTFCDPNEVCTYNNQGAFAFYLLRNGLLRHPSTSRSNSLRSSSTTLGAYRCYQYTRGGSLPDLSLKRVTANPKGSAEEASGRASGLMANSTQAKEPVFVGNGTLVQESKSGSHLSGSTKPGAVV